MSEKNIIRDPADGPTPADRAKDILHSRQISYQQTFSVDKNVHARDVLEDLARFCRANESSFHLDSRVHAALEGRREVWLRIQQHLNLELDSLSKIFIKER